KPGEASAAGAGGVRRGRRPNTHSEVDVARSLRSLLIGVLILVAAVLLIDWSVTTTVNSYVPVTVTIESDKPFRLRKVAYDHYAKTETIEHPENFREARI